MSWEWVHHGHSGINMLQVIRLKLTVRKFLEAYQQVTYAEIIFTVEQLAMAILSQVDAVIEHPMLCLIYK